MPLFRKRWHRRVFGYSVIYAVLLMLIFGCSDRLMLFPSHDPMEIAGQSRIEVPGPAGKIEIWTDRPVAAAKVEPRAFVLAFVGNASRAEYEAEDTAGQWEGLPVEVWGVNYPGYGGSEGAALLKNFGPAALAAYDALSKHAAGRPIFVSGNSIGTTASLYVAAHRQVAGLVLKNPPPLRQLILGRHGWWNLWLIAGPVALHIPGELDSVANAKNVKAKTIFLLASEDEVIPPAYHQKVVDALAGPKTVIDLPGAHHNTEVSGAALVQLRAQIRDLWARAGLGEIDAAK
ncbi:MAG TPA: hypothetical protein VH370_06460 [Humisphaera sp.]|nr:hypothetical protein [Humisphaera sp.]